MQNRRRRGWLIYFTGDRNPHQDRINTHPSPPATQRTIRFIYIKGGVTADGATGVNQQRQRGRREFGFRHFVFDLVYAVRRRNIGICEQFGGGGGGGGDSGDGREKADQTTVTEMCSHVNKIAACAVLVLQHTYPEEAGFSGALEPIGPHMYRLVLYQKLCSLPAQFVHVFHMTHHKQPLFPYTTLTNWRL
jgi:hypothetical protein